MTGESRPARIYTRRGDGGETGILGPRRLRKDDPRIEAYGAVDELNAWIGLARAECPTPVPEPEGASPGSPQAQTETPGVLSWLALQLERIQGSLLVVGAELATDPAVASDSRLPRVRSEDVESLERLIDEIEQALLPLNRFILPGGTRLAAILHIARTVARRAERRVVSLAAREPVRPELLAYLNRLSDLLFVMARRANAASGVADVPWVPRR